MRQRKYAKFYKLYGKMPSVAFPSAKVSVPKTWSIWLIIKPFFSQSLKEAAAKAGKTSSSLVKTKRPPIMPGSSLLQVRLLMHFASLFIKECRFLANTIVRVNYS